MSSRQSIKSLLTKNQYTILDNYFNTVSKLPIRSEKLELSRKLELNPFIVNKWFQTQRNREKYKKKIIV
jgi:hypothetical protein